MAPFECECQLSTWRFSNGDNYIFTDEDVNPKGQLNLSAQTEEQRKTSALCEGSDLCVIHYGVSAFSHSE